LRGIICTYDDEQEEILTKKLAKSVLAKILRRERPTSYNMPKEFLTVKEVARLLGVTPLTVRNWDARGKLTAHRHPLNNYRMYKNRDVEELLREFEISKVAKKIPSPAPEPEKPKVRKLKIDML